MIINEGGISRLWMTVAFIAGMAITAVLAQTPVAADIFSPQPIHEPVVPTLPDDLDSLKPTNSPDTSQPINPHMLVYAIVKGAVSPG